MGQDSNYENFREWLDGEESEEEALKAQNWSAAQQRFISDYFNETDEQGRDLEDREDEGESRSGRDRFFG